MNTRYYETPPEQKSLDDCYNHGFDHGGYGWGMQPDPRWSEYQKDAYLRGWQDARAQG